MPSRNAGYNSYQGKFYNVTLICTYEPAEDKYDANNDTFYEKLEEIYDKCPANVAKIVVGNFNAKIGREGIFDAAVGEFGLYDNTTPNSEKLIGFSAARIMVALIDLRPTKSITF